MSERRTKHGQEVREMLRAMQNGEMTVSRGVELVDMWLAGNYSDDMLPPVREGLGEDEMPWDRIDALTAEVASAIAYNNNLQDAIESYRAEVAELRHEQAVLRDPASLHANLLRGIPATLTKEQLLHLAGCTDYDALKNDSERLDWVERTIFERKWLGGLDSPSHWFIRGDYRHTTQVMRGETIRAAIDAALAKDSSHE